MYDVLEALTTHAHVMSKGEFVFSESPSELSQDEILKRYMGTPRNELGEV